MLSDSVTSKDNSQKDIQSQPLIIQKISKNNNIPLEEFLDDNDVISLIKSEEKILKRYLDSEKIKKLIMYITKEPKDDNYLIGYKYPYISYQILKSDCGYISKRFILNEDEYYEKFLYFEDFVNKQNLDLELKKLRNNNERDYNKELSLLKEIDEILNKTKRIDENKENNKENIDSNEYLDLLLEILNDDKIELNYILSGYFSDVVKNLLDKYPLEMYKYFYIKRKEIVKKILFRSYQKSFAELSEKLLHLESLSYKYFKDKKMIEDFITENSKYRNNIIKEVLKSIDLKGLKFNDIYITDINNILSLIFGLIDQKSNVMSIFESNSLSLHIYNILNTNLYDESNENDDNYFYIRYNIYCLFIKFISDVVKKLNKNYYNYRPKKEDFKRVKDKKSVFFKDFLICSLENIIKNNFRPKNNLVKNGLGILNVYIVDFVKNMLNFMHNITVEFDEILLNNNFCEKSLEYFFKYQWNNIYHNIFLEFFWLYLENEKEHQDITNCFFHKIKLQNLLCDFLENKENEGNNNFILPKMKTELKSGNKIKSGIFSHIIFLIYKIQFHSGLETFSEKEIKNMNIRILGEFKFLNENQLKKESKKKSEILKNILSEDKRWCEMFKNLAFPIIKRYEIQLFKKEFNRMVNSKKLDQQKNNINKDKTNKDNININNTSNKNNTTDTNKTNPEKNLMKDNEDKGINNKNNEKKEKIEKIENKVIINNSDIIINNNYYDDFNYWKIDINLNKKFLNNADNNEEDELIKIAMSLENKEKIKINENDKNIHNQSIDNKINNSENNKEKNNNENPNKYEENKNKINDKQNIKDQINYNIKEEKNDNNKNIKKLNNEEKLYKNINYRKNENFNQIDIEDLINNLLLILIIILLFL